MFQSVGCEDLGFTLCAIDLFWHRSLSVCSSIEQHVTLKLGIKQEQHVTRKAFVAHQGFKLQGQIRRSRALGFMV